MSTTSLLPIARLRRVGAESHGSPRASRNTGTDGTRKSSTNTCRAHFFSRKALDNVALVLLCCHPTMCRTNELRRRPFINIRRKEKKTLTIVGAGCAFFPRLAILLPVGRVVLAENPEISTGRTSNHRTSGLLTVPL